jgi:branched-chain amino acid transport system ATP-binding protein
VLKTIFGLVPLNSGKVLWHGKEIKLASYEIAQKGISFVPQGRRVFNHLTIEENLEIGGFNIRDKNELKKRIAEVMETFSVLKERRKSKAATLSGGQQQMLALARGLITKPKLLLLDEPSLGLSPKIVKEVFMKIKEINEKHKTTILIVEHNIKSLLTIASRGYVIDKGKVVVGGASQKLFESGVLEKVFMGKSI